MIEMIVNLGATSALIFGMTTLVPMIDLNALPPELSVSHDLIKQLLQSLTEAKFTIDRLTHQLMLLRRAQFGARAERFLGQVELFQDPVKIEVPLQPKERITYERIARGRPAIAKDLPRVRIEHDLPQAEQTCGGCGAPMKRIGEETSEQIDYIPARVHVLVHARAKYACRCGEGGVKTAELPLQPLPKSNASPNLLAHVLVSKYLDHVPLHRMERIFARHGIELSRSTLCDWVLGSAELLSPVYDAIKQHVLAAPIIGCDDTILPLQKDGCGRTVQARAWAYLAMGWKDGEPYPPAVAYEFTQTRSGEHPARFLDGFSGYLQADAFAGFNRLFNSGQIVEVGCMAHCRRKFYEVAQTHPPPGLAHEALAFIRNLYEIEARIKDRPPDKRHAARQAESVPILASFKTWLDGHYPTLLPRSSLGNAFYYALSNWQALIRYAENGMLAIDNNAVERSIRPLACGRKNYLFVGSERGGRAAATIYSIIETARVNGCEPFEYLADLLTWLHGYRINRVAELLPFNLSK
jgi:transposase